MQLQREGELLLHRPRDELSDVPIRLPVAASPRTGVAPRELGGGETQRDPAVAWKRAIRDEGGHGVSACEE